MAAGEIATAYLTLRANAGAQLDSDIAAGKAKIISGVAKIAESASSSFAAFAGLAAVAVATWRTVLAGAGEEMDALRFERFRDIMAPAVGVSADQLEDLNDALQQTSAFSHDAIRETQRVLLGFNEIKGDNFGRTLGVASDLAAMLGEDLPQAAQTLGRALQDPERGMMALRRAGIMLSQGELELVKNTGDLADKQSLLLDIIGNRVSGMAEAAKNTFMGQLQIAKDALGEAVEGIGNLLLPLFKEFIPLVTGFGTGIQSAAEWMKGLGSHAKSTFFEISKTLVTATAAGTAFTASIVGIMSGAKLLGAAWKLAFGPLGTVMEVVIGGAGRLVGGVLNIAGDLFRTTANVLGTVLDVATGFLGKVVSVVGSALGKISEGVGSLIGSVLSFIPFVGPLLSSVVTGIGNVVGTVVSSVVGGAGRLIASVGDLSAGVFRVVGRGGEVVLDAAGTIIQTLTGLSGTLARYIGGPAAALLVGPIISALREHPEIIGRIARAWESVTTTVAKLVNVAGAFIRDIIAGFGIDMTDAVTGFADLLDNIAAWFAGDGALAVVSFMADVKTFFDTFGAHMEIVTIDIADMVESTFDMLEGAFAAMLSNLQIDFARWLGQVAAALGPVVGAGVFAGAAALRFRPRGHDDQDVFDLSRSRRRVELEEEIENARAANRERAFALFGTVNAAMGGGGAGGPADLGGGGGKASFIGIPDLWKRIQESVAGGTMTDLARRTADNTARTADGVTAVRERLDRLEPGGPARAGGGGGDW